MEWSMWPNKPKMASCRKGTQTRLWIVDRNYVRIDTEGQRNGQNTKAGCVLGRGWMSWMIKSAILWNTWKVEFEHGYTLGSKEPCRLLSQGVVWWYGPAVEAQKGLKGERSIREMDKAVTQFWRMGWVWIGEGEWKLILEEDGSGVTPVTDGALWPLNLIHEVVIRYHKVKWGTNSFMHINVFFMEWAKIYPKQNKI